MITKLVRMTIWVRNQEDAVKFYTEKLGFEKRADNEFWGGRRWITVAPKGQKELEILLEPVDWFEGEARKKGEQVIGNQPIGVFETNDCEKTYQELTGRGVKAIFPPQEQMWGIEARLEDLYGNQFSLLQPKV
jgi:predicted enzyme related to lactoylglutathione lyase